MLVRSTRKVNYPLAFSLLLIAVAMVYSPVTRAKRSNSPVLMATDAVQPLEGRNGYALIELDVNGVAPSIEFARRDRKTGRRSAVREYTLSLSERGKGLYLMQLPPGTYQITRVNAPHYNLPFQKSTDGDSRWRFKVESGKTSYLGLLQIAEERSRSYVDIELHNRIATTLDDIEEQLGPVVAAAPLVMGRTLRDDFLLDLRGAEVAP